MSVLSFPRIVINGEISWDPATTNNSLGTGYAKDPVKIDLPPGIEMDEFDDWLTMWNVGGSTNGGWNVYGTHHVVSTATATNFVTGPGENTTTDPMAGAEFKFVRGTPKLVDTNPYSPVTSQIFLREMICQGDGVGFSGPAEMRMTSRHPFFQRNLSQNLAIAGGMGVIWQTCIAHENIQWIGGDKPPGIIGQLKSMMGKNGVKGLMIRFSAYTTLYFKNFVDGGIVNNNDPRGYTAIAKHWKLISPVNPGNVAGALNPAISTLTGAIGLWQDGDLTTVPSDRMMQAELITDPNVDKRFQLGATSAKVNAEQGVVSFDMMNTLPLAKRDNTAAPVGDLHVTAQSGTDSPVPIGVISQAMQDKDNFEANGGILDVQIDNTDAASLNDMTLGLASPGNTCTAMQEIDLMAEVDARAVYLDEGDTGSFTVNVSALGGTLPSGTKVFAKLLPWPSVAKAPIELTGGTAQSDGRVYDVTNTDGTVDIPLKGTSDGSCVVLVEAFTGSTPPDIQTQVLGGPVLAPTPWGGYAAVRVLPTDAKIAAVTDDKLDWDYVYDNVLRPFDLVYRGMSCGIFNLGNEDSVKAHASQIASLTDPSNFDSPLYMPVTRDLSKGRRSVLMRFLGIDEAPPPTS